jgi:ABC-type Fe3+-hydroxamate transport system substrate-binding protein
VETLRSWGIPVWVTYPRTVAETLKMIGDLGEITGARAAAARLRGSVEAALARVRAGVGGRPSRRVFYAIWRAPYMTVNADTYISDVLATGGAENIFAGHADRYPVISLDDVAVGRPEVILLPDEPFRFRRAHLADFAPYAEMPAVRDGRVHLVDGKAFSWHGRRILDALRTLPGLLTGSAAAHER